MRGARSDLTAIPTGAAGACRSERAMIGRRSFLTGAAALAACTGLPGLAQALAPMGDNRLPVGFHNFIGTNLAHWQAALSAQQRGEANAVIGCLGDSTVAGQGAGGNDLASNAKSLSWPTQLAKLIPNGSWSSVWGDNNVVANAGDMHSFDARLNRAGWTTSTIKTSGTLCGGFFQGEPTTRSQSFTPTNPIDTIEVWYAQSPGNGDFTIDVDGGLPLATVNCDGPNAFLRAVARCPLGLHTINLQHTANSAGDIYLTGMRVYNSAIKEVSVYNLGGCRWQSTDFVVDTYPWSTLPAVTAIAPNLVIFQAGQVNDWDNHTPLSAVTANMRAVIAALKSVKCDVILMSGVPSKPDYLPSYAAQQAYVANMQKLAYAADVPFIDVWTLFGGSWNKAAMFDWLHPNATGYELIAGYVEAAVLNPTERSAS
jgi:lysophospholipase L1-like esterase